MKTRKVVQVLYKDEWTTLIDLEKEDKMFLVKKYPELQIYFNREDITEKEVEL